MKSRSKSAHSAKSQFEVSFEKAQTFKRNKRYIDIPKAQILEKQHQIIRRMPNPYQGQHKDNKFEQSLMNSTAQLTERLVKDIDKYRSRISFSLKPCDSPRSLNSFVQSPTNSPAKIRSFSMARMTSRDYHDQIMSKPQKDERLFNNFQKFYPATPLACNFQKMKGHIQENSHKHLNDIYHETQKPFQHFYYKKTTNYCRVDYNSQKKLKSQRYFFIPERPQGKPATSLQPNQVDRGLKIATNYKGRNISTANIDDFYRNSGRKNAPQLEMRNMTPLTDHWRNNKEKQDFQLKKMKQDMKAERVRKIKGSKKAQILRKDVCNERFFRRAVRHKNQL